MVLVKKKKNALLIDIVVPDDIRVEEEEEKLVKYQYLACEVKRLWQFKTSVKVTPVVTGDWVQFPRSWKSVGMLQKAALFGTARVLCAWACGRSSYNVLKHTSYNIRTVMRKRNK